MKKKELSKKALMRLARDISEADDLIRFEERLRDVTLGNLVPLMPTLTRQEIEDRFSHVDENTKDEFEENRTQTSIIRRALVESLGRAYQSVKFYWTLPSISRKDYARAAGRAIRLSVSLNQYLGGNVTVDIQPNREAIVQGNFPAPGVLTICLLNFSQGCRLVEMKPRSGSSGALLDIRSRASRRIQLLKRDVDLEKDELALIVLQAKASD